MPRLIQTPTVVAAAGTKPKRIEEYAGRVNTGHERVSVARMLTLVLRGMLRVEFEGGVLEVRAGQAVTTAPGEWVRYSTPEQGGAEYVAVCTPAFSPDTVHRDD
jgi:hypothetical protein